MFLDRIIQTRFICLVFLIIIISSNHLQSQVTTLWNSDTSFYFYEPGPNAENLITKEVTFDTNLNKNEILDSVASFLSDTYFFTKNNYFKGKRKINIDIKNITEINLSNRIYSIATVNIDDPDKVCMGTYFQGSTGGYNTFLLLVSNLLQPQLEIPLLDGIIFLYNGEELKNMDHINLEGLISEREIDSIVKKNLDIKN